MTLIRNTDAVSKQQPDVATPFGHPMRNKHFPCFDSAYIPLNHGSFGAFPTTVRDRQRELQDQTEARADYFLRYTFPDLLEQAREAVAPLLGVATDEVVFIPNVTTGVNTVLRSLVFTRGDVILHFSTDYDANYKTIDYMCESTPAEQVLVEIEYPIEDDEIVKRFRDMVARVNNNNNNNTGGGDGSQKKRVKIALFDTVVAFPGVRMPWEALVKACRELGVLSLIDGAHGIGHIDLTGLGEVGPDFFTSNCYKWLYVPRGCAVLHVPFRNQELIRSCLPTSWGYYQARKPSSQNNITTDKTLDKAGYNNNNHDPIAIPPVVATSSSSSSEEKKKNEFAELFAFVATIDTTPYLCIPEALRFRQLVCGGEEGIREYCQDIAQIGGRRVAEILGTEVMQNSTHTLTNCSFVNVRLPLTFSPSVSPSPSPGPTAQEYSSTTPHGSDDDNAAVVAVAVVEEQNFAQGLKKIILSSSCPPQQEFDSVAAESSKKDKKKIYNPEDAPRMVRWIIERALVDFDIPIMMKFHAGAVWIRLSGQIYIELQDFERAAEVLKVLCEEVSYMY